MNPNVLEFFSKLAEDPKLRGKFKGKSLDECYETAVKSENWNFTKEEFLDFLREARKQKKPIDDEELSSVSGGSYTTVARSLDLFSTFTQLLNSVGFLCGAIINFKKKADEDTLRGYEKKNQELEEIIKQYEKNKKLNNILSERRN